MRGISARVQEMDLMKRRLNYYMLDRSICYPLHEGIWLVTGFPSTNRFEKPVKAMVRRIGEDFIVDDFCDEVAVVLEQEDSLSVVSGCSHNGMINICQRVSSYFQRPVDTFLGGTHLVAADSARLRSTIKALGFLRVRRIAACHCNGQEANELFARELRGYLPVHSGSVIEL